MVVNFNVVYKFTLEWYLLSVGPLSESSGAMCNGYHPLDIVVFRLVPRELSNALFERSRITFNYCLPIDPYNSSLLEFLYIKSIHLRSEYLHCRHALVTFQVIVSSPPASPWTAFKCFNIEL